MHYTVPYGDDTLTVTLPASMRGTLIESGAVQPPGDFEAVLRQALEQPLNSPTLSELAAGSDVQRVCIVFTDTSRACPDHLLVPLLLEQLAAAGLPARAITLVCAVGLHRPLTQAELRAKLGADVANRHRVINHAARYDAGLVHLGWSRHHVPLVANKQAAEADLLIATGVVEPHNFAGYSGGAKTLTIGCGGEATIGATHSLAMIDRPGVRLGCIGDNPFQEVVRAGAVAAGLDFVFNVVLDAEDRILAAAAGSPNAVHDALVACARRVYEVPVERQFDLAIAGAGRAKNANIYQATRAATYLYYAPTPVVRPGGLIIVPARCPEGAGSGPGERRFHQALRDAPDVSALVAELREKGYPPGVQRTYMVARAMAEIEFLIAGAQSPQAVRECKMTPVDSIEDGLAYAQQKLGRDLAVAIVPHATQTLPIVASSGRKL
jgi:nickel-dependent lactate racemase